MSRRKLVIWDSGWAPYRGEFAARLDESWEVTAAPGGLDWLRAEMHDASALVALRIPREVLPESRQLEVFLFPGAGLLEDDPEGIPLGCSVTTVSEHETPVAEYVLMMMLAHVTRLRTYLASFREGRWDGSGRVGGAPHGELFGRTVGLFGYGRIGKAIALRARAFGMRVAAIRRSGIAEAGTGTEPDFLGTPEDLPELLRQSDYLVIAAPLTDETRGRIGKTELETLPAGACLINVSRAEIVQEEALYAALESRVLAGAALDVWYRYPEPGASGHGSRLPFHLLENVYCTPHYSAWSQGMILRRISRMCETLIRFSRGQELDRVVFMGRWQA